MSIVSFLLVLVLIGVALWFFNVYVTAIDPKFKTLINAIVVLIALIWTLQAFGVLGGNGIGVPRIS
jgi:hypothetical protein